MNTYVVCIEGTWNDPSQKDSDPMDPDLELVTESNVLRMFHFLTGESHPATLNHPAPMTCPLGQQSESHEDLGTPLYLPAYCPQPLPPVVWASSNPSVAIVSETGFVTVLTPGQVDIIVSPTSGHIGPQTWSAVVDPQAPPQPLGELLVLVREDDGSDTRIPGVLVEVLDSYNAGRSAVTNQFGAILLDRVLLGTFAVRASKSGYVTFHGDVPLRPAKRANPQHSAESIHFVTVNGVGLNR